MSLALSTIFCEISKPNRLKLCGLPTALFDDQDARLLGLLLLHLLPRGCRPELGYGREAALEREIGVDLAAGVAAVEPELSVVGPQDIAVDPAVVDAKGVLVEDSRDDEVLEAS